MATVGVTGHRIITDRILIDQSVREVLLRFAERFNRESMTLLTSLAEGSDRIVAAHFREGDSLRIVAVLPMSTEEYRKDFADQSSQKEFSELLEGAEQTITMPDLTDRNAAYEAAGCYIVDRCDALICIWDGLREQGTGGTGAMVERARKRGIPIAWIHAGNRKPGTMIPTSLGEEQGKITYENF